MRIIYNKATGSQWINRRDDAAARGGCRHKSIYWSIKKQGPPHNMKYTTGFGGICQ